MDAVVNMILFIIIIFYAIAFASDVWFQVDDNKIKSSVYIGLSNDYTKNDPNFPKLFDSVEGLTFFI